MAVRPRSAGAGLAREFTIATTECSSLALPISSGSLTLRKRGSSVPPPSLVSRQTPKGPRGPSSLTHRVPIAWGGAMRIEQRALSPCRELCGREEKGPASLSGAGLESLKHPATRRISQRGTAETRSTPGGGGGARSEQPCRRYRPAAVILQCSTTCGRHALIAWRAKFAHPRISLSLIG